MMNVKQYMLLIVMLIGSIGVWAQTEEEEKEYFYYPTEYVTHCQDGGTYVWRGHNLNSSGTYHDTVFTGDPVDSIYTITLTVSTRYERTISLRIIKGDSIAYRGVVYKTATKKDITIKGVEACDTIEHLIISIASYFDVYKSSHFCKADTTIYWRDQVITKTGEYLSYSQKKDTLYHYTVTISPIPPKTEETIRHCTAQKFKWHGKEISGPGDYSISLPSKDPEACDTVATLHYIVESAIPAKTNYHYVCGSKSYEVHGKKYFGDQEFREKYHSIYGCDSIVIEKYVADAGTYFFKNDSVDFKKTPKYYWDKTGKYYTKAGANIDSVSATTPGGCGTLYYLYLAPITHSTTTGCQGETFTYEGQLVTKDTTFVKITRTAEGWMDNVVYTHYKFNPVFTYVDDHSPLQICHDEKWMWYYDASKPTEKIEISEAKFPKLNSKDYIEITQEHKDNKCIKSSIKVKIRSYTVVTKDKVVRSLDSCKVKDYKWVVREGDTITIHQTKAEKKTYMDTLKNPTTGCDSILTKREFVCTKHCSPLDTLFLYQTPLTINGKQYTECGKYESFISVGNIDSIYNFILIPYPDPSKRDTTIYGCAHDLPVKNPYNHDQYYEDCDTVVHMHYRKQACDSALLYMHVRILSRIHDTIDTGFCANKPFVLPYRKLSVSVPGIYCDTIRGEHDLCDSIVPYSLTKWLNDTIIDSIRCADQGPFLWKFHPLYAQPRDSIVTKPGDYVNIFNEHTGCDRFRIFRVMPAENFIRKDTDMVCSKELPYLYHGESYNESCDTMVHFATTYCDKDSDFYLHLTVVNDTMVKRYIPLYRPNTYPGYPGGKYNFYGWELTSDSVGKEYSYTTHRKGPAKCDSIDRVEITVVQPIKVTKDTCRGILFQNSIRINQDTTFFYTYTTTAEHLDSIVQYYFRVHTGDTVTVRVNLDTIASGEYQWHGQTYTQPGFYYYDTISTFGCDSVERLILSNCSHQEQEITLYERPCETDLILCDGQRITEDDTCVVTTIDEQGCVTTTTRIIQFRKRYVNFEDSILYDGKTILWHGKVYDKEGTYYDTEHAIKTQDGQCDSIVAGLRITLHVVLRKDTTIYLADTDIPFYHIGLPGKWVNHDTMIVDTIKNKHHIDIDSLYFTYRYVITTHYSKMDYYTMCQGHPVYIEGVLVTKGDIYYKHIPLSKGDSIYRFTVREISTRDTIIHRTGCDSVSFDGTLYFYDSGTTYPDTIKLVKTSVVTQCDSIIHLILNLKAQPRSTYLDVTLPKGKMFEYYSRKYTRDTMDVIPLKVDGKCDSLVHLNLHYYDTITAGLYYHCCKGDSLTISGKKICVTTDMTVTDTLPSVNDTIFIKMVKIVVSQPFMLYKVPEETTSKVCAGKQITFDVAYKAKTEDGLGTPNFYDVHFLDNGIEQLPEDSTYKIDPGYTSYRYPITMRLVNDNCIYPGDYRIALTFRSSICFSQKDTLTLKVLYPASMMYSKWDNTVMINQTYHDAEYSDDCYWDIVPPFVWYLDGAEAATLGDPTQAYYYHGGTIATATKIKFQAARAGYSPLVSSYEYSFMKEEAKPGATGKPHISVSPKLVGKRTSVHIQSSASGTYQLFSATGQKLISGYLDEGDNAMLAPDLSGCYLLQVTLQDGSSQVEKLLVY